MYLNKSQMGPPNSTKKQKEKQLGFMDPLKLCKAC